MVLAIQPVDHLIFKKAPAALCQRKNYDSAQLNRQKRKWPEARNMASGGARASGTIEGRPLKKKRVTKSAARLWALRVLGETEEFFERGVRVLARQR